jgi:hypothetical protein
MHIYLLIAHCTIISPPPSSAASFPSPPLPLLPTIFMQTNQHLPSLLPPFLHPISCLFNSAAPHPSPFSSLFTPPTHLFTYLFTYSEAIHHPTSPSSFSRSFASNRIASISSASCCSNCLPDLATSSSSSPLSLLTSHR